MVKVKEADGGHGTKIDIQKGQAAQEYVWSGGFFAIADEDRNDKYVGRDSHDYVDGLQGQVEEDALYLMIAPIKHTEGFYCGIDVSCGIERELSWEQGWVEWWGYIFLQHFSSAKTKTLLGEE